MGVGDERGQVRAAAPAGADSSPELGSIAGRSRDRSPAVESRRYRRPAPPGATIQAPTERRGRHGPRLGVGTALHGPRAARAQPLVVDGGVAAVAGGLACGRPGVWGGVRLAVRKPCRARQERTDQRDWAESREPVLSQEAVERKESAEPIEPADRTLPTEPMERTLPTEPMDSTDPTEPMESIDSFEPIDRNDPRRRGRVMGPSCQAGGVRRGSDLA